jgi:hypothetical protein
VGELPRILFFGDDFGGWMAGFDSRDDWRLVGVDSASPQPHPQEGQTLEEFIARRVADNQDGEPGAPPDRGGIR